MRQRREPDRAGQETFGCNAVTEHHLMGRKQHVHKGDMSHAIGDPDRSRPLLGKHAGPGEKALITIVQANKHAMLLRKQRVAYNAEALIVSKS